MMWLMHIAGHLFVANGKIESLAHDAVVIPVDAFLDFNPIWRPLLGTPWPEEPTTWADGWGRIDHRNQWLVEVGDGDYDRVLDRLERIVRDIASAEPRAGGARSLPLVALPVLGVGLGGHSHEPGLVLRRLVTLLSALATDLHLDIALVTPEAAVFAAAQFARRALKSPLTEPCERIAHLLGERARSRELALFLGAGVSIPAGLKSWDDLIGHLASAVPSITKRDLETLTATDQAELVERIDPKGFRIRVADLVRPATRPALLHVLLAGLDVGQVVTTNYDLLYECAVEATERDIQSVMPWSSALGAERWVLKLHGDIDHADKIVLTRRHMVRYDAANRPSGALLQSLLLTKHLLVVGASLTDDNVIRLAHEVQAYRDEHQDGSTPRPFGTVLDASPSGDRVRARLWEGQLDWVHLADLGAGSSHRALELLLDRVGVHASRDSSWLLDERFAGLLASDVDRGIAARARALSDELADAEEATWGPLRTRLGELGAT